MKDNINGLITHQKTARAELKQLLEELSQIEIDKLSEKDIIEVRCSILSLEVEYNTRLSFINDLENLL